MLIVAGFGILIALVGGFAWTSVSAQIRILSERVKDYMLVTPNSPGVQGVISARLFEAMKDVCDTGKVRVEAHRAYQAAYANATMLMSDVDQLMKSSTKADRDHENAVDRLKKIEESVKTK